MTIESNDRPSTLTTQLRELRSLRDELRVRGHLAGMEARDAWNKLEPRFTDLEQRAERAGISAVDDLLAATAQLRAAFVHYRDRLDGRHSGNWDREDD